MADNATWVLVGIGVGVGLAAAAWWVTRQNGGIQQLQSEPLVRQHVVNRDEDGLIESVETSTFPGSQVGGGVQPDLEVVSDAGG